MVFRRINDCIAANLHNNIVESLDSKHHTLNRCRKFAGA